MFDRDGRHLNTLKVSMPFVDTVVWDGAGNLYAGGAFQNTRPPYEGAVVRFAPRRVGKGAVNGALTHTGPSMRFTCAFGA